MTTRRSAISSAAELPAVAVPEVPDAEPALWPLIVYPPPAILRLRNSLKPIGIAPIQYTANAHRETLRGKGRDLGDYLRSLDMVMEIAPVTPLNRSRAAQLCQPLQPV